MGGAAVLGAGVAKPAGEALAGASVKVAAMWEGLVVGASVGGLLLGPKHSSHRSLSLQSKGCSDRARWAV